MRGALLGGVAVAAMVGAPGCATEQVVSLAIEPAPVDVYVDGRLAASGDPEALALRADRGHVVLIRRPGFHSEQVVIESVEREGVSRLEPAHIALRLRPEQERGRRIEVELAPEDGGDGAAAAAEPGDAEEEERR